MSQLHEFLLLGMWQSDIGLVVVDVQSLSPLELTLNLRLTADGAVGGIENPLAVEEFCRGEVARTDAIVCGKGLLDLLLQISLISLRLEFGKSIGEP